MDRYTVWTPQKRQKTFMSRPEYEVLYGGAAGGGKSDALVIEALRQVHIPHYKGLILRKSYPQLMEIIDKSRGYYQQAYPGARYNSTTHCWTFPSGAKIYFGAMFHAKDKLNYQGQQYDFIAFDELTHFTWDEYSYMFSRNRPSGPGTRVYIRSTANPGGIGHGWVKQRFITAAKPLTTIYDDLTVSSPTGERISLRKSRCFVPATVFDNQKLLDNDPNYLASLALLPEAEKKALLYGDWESFSGQVFSEFVNDPAHYKDRMYTNVIDPFIIPGHWKILRGFDWGYSKPFSVGWYAVDERGCIYRIREFYGCTDTPNCGLQIPVDEIARHIKEIENEDENLRGKPIMGVADPAIFESSHGESIADIMSKPPYYVSWSPGDHKRLAGKMQYHYRFRFNDMGLPLFYVFNTCKHFIRTIPTLVYDDTHIEDINTEQEDHIYDECRYVLMTAPISPPKAKEIKLMPDDPLDMRPQNNVNFFMI